MERARTTSAQRIGDVGEDLVAAGSRLPAGSILARNLRLGRDELDLVAVDPGPPATLVVVEVRRRGRRDFGLAEESLDSSQASRAAARGGGAARRGRAAGRAPAAGTAAADRPGGHRSGHGRATFAAPPPRHPPVSSRSPRPAPRQPARRSPAPMTRAGTPRTPVLDSRPPRHGAGAIVDARPAPAGTEHTRGSVPDRDGAGPAARPQRPEATPAAPDGDPRRQGTAGGHCAHRIDASAA